jgi:hypothetical protein
MFLLFQMLLASLAQSTLIPPCQIPLCQILPITKSLVTVSLYSGK